jgi:hypothetical protein
MSGTNGTQWETLYTLAAPITKNTFTTEAAITGVAGTNTVCKLPAGFFQDDVPNPVGRSLILELDGIIANTAAATFVLNLGLDTTAGTKANAVAVNTAVTPTAAVTAPIALRAKYTCTAYATTTMSLQVNGTMRYESVAAGGAPTTNAQVVGFRGLLTGLSPTADLFIELFGTWSASNAANTTTIDQMFLFGLN